MGRSRSFDESTAVCAAADLFAARGYDGVSIDDLVRRLGMHRGSLYQAFGSKRGLYLAALRWHHWEQLRPLAERIADSRDLAAGVAVATTGPAAAAGLGLLLAAAAEDDPPSEVATVIRAGFAALDDAFTAVLGSRPSDHDGRPAAITAAVAGLRLRRRTGSRSGTGEAVPAALASAFGSVVPAHHDL